MSGQPSQRPLRFLHSSDLHLEQPLMGIGEVPEQLQEVFLDAPYAAAERVFDIALQEQVDFVVLAGDVMLPLAAGPRGLDFVLRQFRRLQQQDMTVYWVRGQVDDFDDWPAAVPLPSNVVRFNDEHVDSITHHRDGQPVAVIKGRAANSSSTFSVGEFAADASLATIAAAYGTTQDLLQRGDVDYWALGGVHSSRPGCREQGAGRGTQESAWYCGSPQGRRPVESGPHGCCLVEVDTEGRIGRQFMTTDIIRWHNVIFELPDVIDRSGLLRMLREKTHQLLETAGGRQLLIRWVMQDGNELTDTKSDLIAARLREGGLAEDLLEALRAEFSTSTPAVWHVEIEVEPPTVLPSGWYEEDTVLGDLLRSIQHYQQDASQPFPLESIPPEAQITEEVADRLRVTAPGDRAMILRRVAALGVDLLRGDRVLAEALDPKSSIRRVMAGGL